MYQTTRNAIADYYRAPAQHREIPAGGVLDFAANEAVVVDDDAAEDKTALHELAGCLKRLFGELSPEDQEALRSVEIEELTQVEAAQRLGLSTSGMKSRVQRARRRFKAIIEDCCRVEQDRRGGIVSFEPRAEGKCGCDSDTCKN